ncbi:MAG: hypothetical protein IMZ58_07280, partial [Thermoplasmata archaeon]|nr:hypothetical protein [Thermoplasmata archaeon]
DNSLNIQFFYPLLVVQNDILDVRQIEKKIIINKTNHIKFNVKDFVKGEEIGYIIDVIKEDFFPDYLKIVKKEMDETAQLLNKKYPTIHHELQKQARKAKIGKTIKIISSLMGKQLINVEKT